ncbi:MAG: hypothetical protein PGMFKBFP_00293 [Anaerolineales bacterium]|nr:hypothetical protein [Anaerolineales bacterium]
MQADFAAAPLRRGDGSDVAFEIREIEQPVVALAEDRARVVPVVVALAVGRVVDVADGGPARRGLVVADETRPQVGLASERLEGLEHDRLRAVTVRFEHLADASLEIESHHHEAARTGRSAFERRGVAPERARAAHDGFVQPGVREGKQPHLVNFTAGDFGQDVEPREDGRVVRVLGLARLGRAAQHVEVGLRRVAEAVHFDGEIVHFDALDKVHPRHAVTVLQEVGRASRGQVVGGGPVHLLREFLAVFHNGVVDDERHFADGDGGRLVGAVGFERRGSRDGRGRGFFPEEGQDEFEERGEEVTWRFAHRDSLAARNAVLRRLYVAGQNAIPPRSRRFGGEVHLSAGGQV